MDPIIVLILIVLVLWATGVFIVPVGSAVHVLLVFVVVLLLMRVLAGRKAL